MLHKSILNFFRLFNFLINNSDCFFFYGCFFWWKLRCEETENHYSVRITLSYFVEIAKVYKNAREKKKKKFTQSHWTFGK